MNLFLGRGCNESCRFCYAGDFFDTARKAPAAQRGAVLEHLRTYAKLVSDAPPLPQWSEDVDELTMTLFASRAVNLLGGEPVRRHQGFPGLTTCCKRRGHNRHPFDVMLIADLSESRTQDSAMAFRQTMLPRNMTRCHSSVDAELVALVVGVPRELSSLIHTSVTGNQSAESIPQASSEPHAEASGS